MLINLIAEKTKIFLALKLFDYVLILMRGSRKFCQRGSNFDVIFLVNERREDPSTIISWPLSARQRNAIKWRFAGVLVIAQHGEMAW